MPPAASLAIWYILRLASNGLLPPASLSCEAVFRSDLCKKWNWIIAVEKNLLWGCVCWFWWMAISSDIRCQSNQRKNFILFILVSLFFSLRDYAGNARNAGMLLRLSLPTKEFLTPYFLSALWQWTLSRIAKEKLILEQQETSLPSRRCGSVRWIRRIWARTEAGHNLILTK